MKNLKLALMGVCLAWTAPTAAYADDCYSDGLMAYVDSRIPSGNQTERRWEKIKAALLEQDGGITLARAEEILAARKSRRLPLEHMDEVVAALKCIANRPEVVEVEVEEVEVEPEPEPEAQPVQAEPQQEDPVMFTTFRVYLHGGTTFNSPNEYRINEDDYWESELIIHFATNRGNILNDGLCINYDHWSGNEYWHNGPIQLSGFTEDFDFLHLLPEGVPNPKYGYWKCTPDINSDPTPPNITILNPVDDGVIDDVSDDDGIVEFVYRGRIRIRDNNVVENDFSIADELQFRYSDGLTGVTKFGPATEEVTDRDSWWRMNKSEVAWAGEWCLGTGSSWVTHSNPTCGEVRPSKWLDRAPNESGNCNKSAATYIVRANVSEDTWLPDHCFSTENVVTIPPTPSNDVKHAFLDNTELPIIEDDDVSRITLHKKNGKWTVSLSRPIMVTDGKGDADRWWMTPDGLRLEVDFSYELSGISFNTVHSLLIPAVNGIVADKDYILDDLLVIRGDDPDLNSPDTDYTDNGHTFARECLTPRSNPGTTTTLVRVHARTAGLNPGKGIKIYSPGSSADVCR